EPELVGQPLAERFVITLAEDEALERHPQPRERFQQYIHAFAANDLARIDDQVAVAERAAGRSIRRTRHGGMDFDFSSREAVAQEFLLHVVAGHQQAMKTPVKLDFLFLGRITDPLQRKASPPGPLSIGWRGGTEGRLVTREKCSAGKDAIS